MSDYIVVSMRNIVKVYPDGTIALRGVDLDLKKGEIHSLLGENGAGKTTLMKILSGLIKPTKGDIFIDGKKVRLKNPSHALRYGIGMVHQHLTLVPDFTAYENIVLGIDKEVPSMGDVEKLMKETGLFVDLNEKIENLSFGVRQRVEILKMLVRKVKVLILDEPTTNLSPIETRDLFKSLKRLKERGHTIALITHKIREVVEIADVVTVLRRGRVVGTVEVQKTNPIELAKMMINREVLLSIEKTASKPRGIALRVVDLHVPSDTGALAVNGVSFDVHYGEIFGIAGVEGNGQVELAEAIAGVRKITHGKIILENHEIMYLPTKTRYMLGLSYIPEDRKTALVLDMSLTENSVLTRLAYGRDYVNALGLIKLSSIKTLASKIVKGFDILAPSLDHPARVLSGGNQQKLVLGRELLRDPKVLIAVQPTRGLDIGATEFIRKMLLKMRDEGKAIILISSDLDEVLGLSDRMTVMYRGRFMGIVEPVSVREEEIGLMMGGYTIEEIKTKLGGSRG